jgi:RHS repeat-associated protein
MAIHIYGTPAIGYNTNQLVCIGQPGEMPSLTSFRVLYTYDANGNRVSRTETGKGLDAYEYDAVNRLVHLDYKSGPAEARGNHYYIYDYRSRRVTRVENGTTTRLSFSGGSYVQTYGTTSATMPESELVRGNELGGGIGGLLYTVEGGAATHNLYNSRGDVISQASATGSVTWEAQYEAFGTRRAETGTAKGRQKANTKDEDPTGLLNEGFRYRDLESGVFLTRDPMGFVDGPNVYTYVRQNPWTMFDPEGLEAFTDKVVSMLRSINDNMMQKGQPLLYMERLPSPLTQRVVLQFVGEEYATQTGGKGVYDWAQDRWANLGNAMESFRDSVGESPTHGDILPESWVRGGGLKKAATQLDPMLHDVGPANIKVKTALKLDGVDLRNVKYSMIMRVSNILTTDAGTADYARRLAGRAVADLSPLISSRSTREQTQIAVDYLRQGPDLFWSRVKDRRGLSEEELTKWKSNPKSFVDSKGNRPLPLETERIDEDQHNQVEGLVDED